MSLHRRGHKPMFHDRGWNGLGTALDAPLTFEVGSMLFGLHDGRLFIVRVWCARSDA